ncbi:MAG: ATP synthase gamma chain [Candidatus Woesebacteria bacterium GW2011_GWB1_39_12]|uniref:ATP synthase gamma chain n=2 Tax=Candidatus Woeseibacteriota TaxID=1752722 RepID=A0A0G0PHT0_9BACT|nr:MAG: ATP synthase gamma chain [Candidatus Woesebacteria bacterium GW2011_GWA1_39_12]KKR01187.1 MAG: ATP synthase gamma chain [Candidatus Woesebacteria bacterium GW2011_GWB1_39_12]
MAYKKEIEQEIIQVSSFKVLTEVYGEIAATRMKKIRGFVLKNREFLASIESIFRDSLASYAKKLSDLVRRGKIKEGGKVTFLAHNGKVVAVLISANTGFYGEVVEETFKKFIEDFRKEDIEATIIGKVGRSLFLEQEAKRPYTYFDLPDYGYNETVLSEVIKHLVQYDEIRVYYGKYQSVVTQKPTAFSISAGTPISGAVEEPKVAYIFEPTVEKILMFFETQIFASLFDQSIRESQLAKFASRILAMDRASQNIDKRLKSLDLEKLKLSHRSLDKKQLNSLAPIYYYGK